MAQKSREETVQYVVKLLKDKADMAYSEVVKAAKSAGHHVYPLIMGLAKNRMGLGRKKRGPGRPRGRKPGRPAGTGARRGRPPGSGRSLTGDFVRGIARLQDEAAAMRAALRDIAKLAARF